MSALMATHGLLISALVAACVLALAQLLIADLIGLRAGHTPGHPVEGGHDSLQWRSARAIGNLNESFAIFVGLAVAAMVVPVEPALAGGLAWTYVGGRVLHGLCYYADWRMARSIAFGLSLLALFILAGSVVRALL